MRGRWVRRVVLFLFGLLIIILLFHFCHASFAAFAFPPPQGECVILIDINYCTIRAESYVFTAPYMGGWRLSWEFPVGKCPNGSNLFRGIDAFCELVPKELLPKPNTRG